MLGGTLMRVELGARVATSDGKDVGTIEKLILDPDTGDVFSVVVRKGTLFHRDIEIPLDGIVGQEAGVARVRYTEAQLHDLRTFDEGSYTTPPPERSTEYA